MVEYTTSRRIYAAITTRMNVIQEAARRNTATIAKKLKTLQDRINSLKVRSGTDFTNSAPLRALKRTNSNLDTTY